MFMSPRCLTMFEGKHFTKSNWFTVELLSSQVFQKFLKFSLYYISGVLLSFLYNVKHYLVKAAFFMSSTLMSRHKFSQVLNAKAYYLENITFSSP